MNIGWNIESYVSVSSMIFSSIILFLILRINWKAYGLLFLLSAAAGEILCVIFAMLGLYSFPYTTFPAISSLPVVLVLTAFPMIVLVGVRYSPENWMSKICLYWVIVNLGMLFETWAQNQTQIIKYDMFWDFWDSYTWWWIYLLVFEWLGGRIVPQSARKPIKGSLLKSGQIGWFISHFILISTIFLAGFYMGRVTLK
ncbi:hypothetical protein Sgly_1746 [Syntrophobotulus glycolicus DSM 8271]|uniref:Carotenoid biosynthesis protein n=1 Tax=Syntrophobotulus glycolicus (strain DSM 8271 / FlGlyR) TaxID=645991 RepID=F0SZ06_SYNGF|nr:CBO0543 family protein [Syntrophobotulus glycolicus]ADY56043.1 hypothetical protein Sgly_1746 [Syntrophobotulus glycolicus DSM 8271]